LKEDRGWVVANSEVIPPTDDLMVATKCLQNGVLREFGLKSPFYKLAVEAALRVGN
jgi:hypothetical protein